MSYDFKMILLNICFSLFLENAATKKKLTLLY